MTSFTWLITIASNSPNSTGRLRGFRISAHSKVVIRYSLQKKLSGFPPKGPGRVNVSRRWIYLRFGWHPCRLRHLKGTRQADESLNLPFMNHICSFPFKMTIVTIIGANGLRYPDLNRNNTLHQMLFAEGWLETKYPFLFRTMSTKGFGLQWPRGSWCWLHCAPTSINYTRYNLSAVPLLTQALSRHVLSTDAQGIQSHFKQALSIQMPFGLLLPLSVKFFWGEGHKSLPVKGDTSFPSSWRFLSGIYKPPSAENILNYYYRSRKPRLIGSCHSSKREEQTLN